MRCASALLLLLILCAVFVPVAHAQVKRCTADDGRTIYTDRKCAEIGANKFLPDAITASGSTLSVGHAVCARTLQELTSALELALHSGDPNKLASLYDWTGIRSAEANRLLDRLQVIVSRPLVELQPLLAEPSNTAIRLSTDASSRTHFATPQRDTPRITGLHAEQVQADGSSPAHADFGVNRRMGCWWLHL